MSAHTADIAAAMDRRETAADAEHRAAALVREHPDSPTAAEMYRAAMEETDRMDAELDRLTDFERWAQAMEDAA